MQPPRGAIRIVTILGTTRPGNYTSMALELVNDELRKLGADVDCIDPTELSLPFPGQPATLDAAALKERVKGATGIVMSTPEYHGSFSSLLKLVIENLGFPSALAGKPISLLGVAAGRIGAIKSLEQLRSVCAHVGGMVLPAVVSVPMVQQVFDKNGVCSDPLIEKLIRSVGGNLVNYIHRHLCPSITLEAIVRGEIRIEDLSTAPVA